MKTSPANDPQNLVTRSLDAIFHSLLDEARSNFGVSVWPEALAMMTVRLTAEEGSGEDKWAQVVESRSPGYIPELLRSLAQAYELVHAALDGVFTRALLPVWTE